MRKKVSAPLVTLRRLAVVSIAVAMICAALSSSVAATEQLVLGDSGESVEPPFASAGSTPQCGTYGISGNGSWYSVGYRNCDPNGKWHRPVYLRHGTATFAPCVGPGQISGYLGFRRSQPIPPVGPPYQFGELTTYLGASAYTTCRDDSGAPISPPPGLCDICVPCPEGTSTASTCDQDPPRQEVTARGRVEVWRNEGGSETRGLAGARYEGKFFDGEQWQPLTTGPAGTGSQVKGFLDQDGGYEITFAYPNRDQEVDGTRRKGCPDPGDGAAFAGAHACVASHIVLDVFPENADGSIRVFKPSADEVEPGWDAHIGRFFESGTAPQQHVANSPSTHAYGGVLNVRAIAGPSLGRTEVRLVPEGTSIYNPETGRITLREAAAPTSIIEHEAAHQWQHHIYGHLPDAPNCSPHSFGKPSSAGCALLEGFAHFVAVVSENKPGESTWNRMSLPGGHVVDLENCRTIGDNGGIVPCSTEDPGARDAEGWFTAALWDLYDNTPTEKVGGHQDLSRYSADQVLAPFADKPKSFKQLWASWTARYPNVATDTQVAFLNHQLYDVKQDVSSTRAGQWEKFSCVCVGNSALRLAPGAPKGAAAVWNTTGVDRTKTYDIWVNNPATTQADRDPKAAYVVHTADGPRTFTLDQNTQPSWVRLTGTTPVRLKANSQVVLTAGTPGRPIAADGIILVPTT